MKIRLLLLAYFLAGDLCAKPINESEGEGVVGLSKILEIECDLDPTIQEFKLELDGSTHVFLPENKKTDANVLIPKGKKLPARYEIKGQSTSVSHIYDILKNKTILPGKNYVLDLTAKYEPVYGVYRVGFDLKEQ